MNNMDYQYDTTCRLSAEDKQMMTRVSSCNRFTETSTVRNSNATYGSGEEIVEGAEDAIPIPIQLYG